MTEVAANLPARSVTLRLADRRLDRLPRSFAAHGQRFAYPEKIAGGDAVTTRFRELYRRR
jgi:hypothetical protein